VFSLTFAFLLHKDELHEEEQVLYNSSNLCDITCSTSLSILKICK